MSGGERWRILRLHVEDQIPLTALSRETGIGLRTLQRWHQLYRDHGITALDPQPRADAGIRRTGGELVRFIEHLALTRPRPAIATLHRLASTEAERQGLVGAQLRHCQRYRAVPRPGTGNARVGWTHCVSRSIRARIPAPSRRAQPDLAGRSHRTRHPHHQCRRRQI
ncbi:helix-turn-helix domain-containing protein [Microbacterium sp. Be9]|nr:helix-turn-helix domain-containing protein [Microbacterium sp. Be9]